MRQLIIDHSCKLRSWSVIHVWITRCKRLNLRSGNIMIIRWLMKVTILRDPPYTKHNITCVRLGTLVKSLGKMSCSKPMNPGTCNANGFSWSYLQWSCWRLYIILRPASKVCHYPGLPSKNVFDRFISRNASFCARIWVWLNSDLIGCGQARHFPSCGGQSTNQQPTNRPILVAIWSCLLVTCPFPTVTVSQCIDVY